MSSSPGSIVAAMQRMLGIPRWADGSADRAVEPSPMEHLETIFRAAGQTLGECPSWVLIAIEQAERSDARNRGSGNPDRQERTPSC